MLTYTYISKGNFRLAEKPKPTIAHNRDAIVKVTLASICSSKMPNGEFCLGDNAIVKKYIEVHQ